MDKWSKDSDLETVNYFVDKLSALRKKLLDAGVGVVGQNIFNVDLYFTSSIAKSVDVLDGFRLMFESRNLVCEASLLRIQMDILMRVYAIYIAEDRDLFLVAMQTGEPRINKLKDNAGMKMQDGYLKERIAKEFDERFSDIYDKCSGFIHHSEKSFTTSIRAKEDYVMEFRIGIPLEIDYDRVIFEVADAFIHFTNLIIDLIQPVIESKERTDIKLQNNDNF